MELETLYYTHRRTGKWAHVIVYAVKYGKLEKLGAGKYQPGATPGVHVEAMDVARDAGEILRPSVEVVELETP